MDQTLLLYPLGVMAFFTLFIGLKMLFARIEAVKKGEMKRAYFALNQGDESEKARKFRQHYENLFECPILFYVVIVLLLSLQLGDLAYLILAWSYVGLRLAHGYVHTTYNYIPHRMITFLASTVVLYVIWGRLLIQISFA